MFCALCFVGILGRFLLHEGLIRWAVFFLFWDECMKEQFVGSVLLVIKFDCTNGLIDVGMRQLFIK